MSDDTERLVTDGGVTVDAPPSELTLGHADPTLADLDDIYLDGTIVLVGCGKTKRDPEDPTDLHLAAVGPGEEWGGKEGPMWRAEDLYKASYFAVKREFAEMVTAWARGRDGSPWAVLSAEHGVVPALRPLAPYDTTIGDLGDDPTNPDHRVHNGMLRRRPDGEEIVTELDLWVTNVAYGLARWIGGFREGTGPVGKQNAKTLLILAGQDYIRPLRERGVFKFGITRMAGNPNEQLRPIDVRVRSLFEEIDAGGIGEQMGWLSDSVDRLEPLINDVGETTQETLKRETDADTARPEGGDRDV